MVIVVSMGACARAPAHRAVGTGGASANANANANASASASASASAKESLQGEAAVREGPSGTAEAAIEIGKGTRVLMFGDSMVWSGLGWTLKEHVVARGGTFSFATKPNATTATWAEGRELQDLLARTRPDVVIVALPANELFIPNPRARIGDIRKIVDRIGSRPCLWIGPSPWRPQKGMLDVVREHAPPCRFFDSSNVAMERQADGIHPTLAGGKAWADAVWQGAFRE